MKEPISVDVDLTRGAGYVQYIEDCDIAETIDVWRDGRVAADVSDDREIVGIELLYLDAETLSHARGFAVQANLAFPVDLAGNLTAKGVGVP